MIQRLPSLRVGVARSVAACLAVALAAPLHAAGDGRSESSDVKAAFILNFARFTQWPDIAFNDPIAICIVDDPRVAASLVTLARGQRIGTHPIDIRPVRDLAGQSCRVAYLSRRESDLPATLAPIRERPVLTVSDSSHFASTGGMIELVAEGDRMRFAINVMTVERAQIKLSSRLLGLARIVRDDDAQ